MDSAAALPLPTRLAGVTVNVLDSFGPSRPAGLIFVSPTQVNFVVPMLTASGTAIVTVTRDGATVAQALVQIVPFAPGIFTANANGRGVPAAQALHVKPNGATAAEPVFQCGSTPGSCVPAPIDLGGDSEQVYLLLYGTGVRNCGSTTVQIGGVDAKVTGSQAQGEYGGLDQVIPRQLAGRGEVGLTLQACGSAANPVLIHIR
jgi:uncharacterized protein (TIGR03437 family)